VSQPHDPPESGEPEVRDALDRRISDALGALRPPPPGPDEPDDETLLAVLEGRASAAESARVAASPLASATVDIVRSEAPATSLSGAARYVFALARDFVELLRGATAPLAPPDGGWAVRSGAGPVAGPVCELRHAFPALDAHLRVEPVSRPGAAPAIDLEVRLTGRGAPIDRGRVILRAGTQLLASTPLDAAGVALFTGLGPARYQLELRSAGAPAGQLYVDLLPA
jgi:hypothetical protein